MERIRTEKVFRKPINQTNKIKVMTEGNDLAYPDPMRGAEQSFSNQDPSSNPSGLTKREYFAAMAMQGLIANAPNGHLSNSKQGCELAIQWADDLITALNTNQ